MLMADEWQFEGTATFEEPVSREEAMRRIRDGHKVTTNILSVQPSEEQGREVLTQGA